jgi:hypothetical protein
MAGFMLMLLNVAQGKPVHFGQLFSGARFIVRLITATILFSIVLMLDLLLIIAAEYIIWTLLGAELMLSLIAGIAVLALAAPGVYFVLTFWPYAWVLVDEDCGVIDSFNGAIAVTRGNLLSGFVLFIACSAIFVGANAAAAIIFCFGFFLPIVAMPFVLLCFSVAYVIARGRRTAERIVPDDPPAVLPARPGN